MRRRRIGRADLVMHIGEQLSAYLDGELGVDDEHRVVGHLETCPACRAELADLHVARAAVRSLPLLDPPEWLQPAPATGIEVARRHPVAAVAAAAAAILALTIGLATLLTPAPAVEVDFAEIASTHRARASVDGLPTGARVVQITPGMFSDGAE